MLQQTHIHKGHNGKVYALFIEDHSPFSNVNPAKFEAETVKKLVNPDMFKQEETLKWNCSEQYFIYHKALFVGDLKTAQFIRDCEQRRPMKAAGKTLNINKQDLDKTKGMFNVEASGNDAFWGLGCWIGDPRFEHEESWIGTNWLGQILDYIREELWVKPEFQMEKEEIEKENVDTRIMFLTAETNCLE